MADQEDPNEPEILYVDPKNLRLGPIRRESLTDDQLGMLRAIYEVISPYQSIAFETMELNFLRDANPDQELAVWSCIATALSRFIDQQPQTSTDERKSVLSCLLLMSMGAKKPDNIDEPLWRYLDSLYTPCS